MTAVSKGKKPGTSVEAFIADMEHPFKNEIVSLRAILLAVDPSIGEEIKWNAPSFCTSGHFATMQWRARDSLQLILHLGAKKRVLPAGAISDPEGLLRWLGPDRAVVSFKSSADLAAKRAALESIVRQWISHV